MCPICRRGNCSESFHSLAEQERWADAVFDYDQYLATWRRIRDEIDTEEQEAEEEA